EFPPWKLEAGKCEIRRVFSGTQRLPLVACLRPIGRTHSPVARAFRAPNESAPGEGGPKRLPPAVSVLPRKSEFAARSEHARELHDRVRREQPSLVMPLLWPGVGEQQENPGNRVRRQPGDHVAGISIMGEDCDEACALDLSKQACHPVDERLAAD